MHSTWACPSTRRFNYFCHEEWGSIKLNSVIIFIRMGYWWRIGRNIYCDRALLVQSQWWWILSGLLCTTCCSPPCPRRSSWAELSWAELGQSMVRLCCDLLSCVAENFLFIAKERQRERGGGKGGHCDGSSENVRSWSGEERRSSSHRRSSTQLKLELIYGPLQMANHVLLLLLRSSSTLHTAAEDPIRSCINRIIGGSFYSTVHSPIRRRTGSIHQTRLDQKIRQPPEKRRRGRQTIHS